MSSLRIEVSEFNSFFQVQSISLRSEVLRKPLNLSFTNRELLSEANQIHITATSGQLVVGCLLLISMTDTFKMRQVAVAERLQGSGIGKALVDFSEKIAQDRDIKKIELHARETAVKFYQNLGYSVVGSMFKEVGIPHFKMQKILNKIYKIQSPEPFI